MKLRRNRRQPMNRCGGRRGGEEAPPLTKRERERYETVQPAERGGKSNGEVERGGAGGMAANQYARTALERRAPARCGSRAYVSERTSAVLASVTATKVRFSIELSARYGV